MCFADCPSGWDANNSADHSFCTLGADYHVHFNSLPSGWSTCYSPTFHDGRGAYFGGDGNFLRWDDFRVSSEHYFGVWVRAKTSGYIFNYNYEARPYNYDRDHTDFMDDNHTLETKRGEFSFFFDECDEDDEFVDDFYGWKLITLEFDSYHDYERCVKIDGDIYHCDEHDNEIHLVQRASGNEFFLGSYRGVHNFFEGFIYGF